MSTSYIELRGKKKNKLLMGIDPRLDTDHASHAKLMTQYGDCT